MEAKKDNHDEASTDNGGRSKIIVYHLNNSRSQSTLWLLVKLGLEYEIVKFQRTSEGVAPEDSKEIHPLGLFPIIKEGDMTLSESGAIIDKLTPTREGWIDNLFYSHYAEGTLMPILVNKLVFTLVPKRAPFFLRPLVKMIFGMLLNTLVEPRLKLHHDFIERHLEKSPSGWFAGAENPTAADFLMFLPMESMAARSANFGPKLQDFLTKVHDRPAYKRALSKGGEFDLKAFWA
ncbi:thioredoxin-like protein [Schizopora paradoxa]|uniref:Thioredoxin-like protein n=1 Tax=Schizopora paradoxa TaxID=27342 RepID=A0A0H2S314_9AGAM|nr:thioredoxin-like protein [Schizopora paradoxa]